MFIVILLGAVPLVLMHTIITRSVKSNTLENTTQLTHGVLDQSQKYINTVLGEMNTFYLDFTQHGNFLERLDRDHLSVENIDTIIGFKKLHPINHQIAVFDMSKLSTSVVIDGEYNVTYLKPEVVEEFGNSQQALLLMENHNRSLWLGSSPKGVNDLERSVWNYQSIYSGSNTYIVASSLDSRILSDFIDNLESSIESEIRFITSDNIIFPKDELYFEKSYAPKTLSRSNKGRFINFTVNDLIIQVYSDPLYYYNLVVTTPQQKLLSGIDDIFRTTSITLVLLTIFSISFGLIGIYMLQSRIREFIDALKGISFGKYTTLTPKGKVTIKEDESLTFAINELSTEVSSNRRLLKDINQQLEKRVEERTAELEQTRDSLINSEKMAILGHNAAKITHEINNPLSVCITASTHLNTIIKELKEKFDRGELTRKHFSSFSESASEVSEMLLSNLQRASELSNSFKHFASDQSSNEKRVLNLNDYLEEIIKSYAYKIKNTHHKIELVSEDRIELETYPAIIYQSVTNLVNNSLLHGFDNIKNGLIQLVLSQDEHNYIIEVIDNGIGISEENLQELYKPFFTTKQGEGGTGLGLNIIKDLIESKLRGVIECHSVLGEGTQFIIKLPKGEIDV